MRPLNLQRDIYKHCRGRRLFTSSINSSSLEKARSCPTRPPHSGYVRLTNRRLIYIYGQDSAQFLQGLTTANIPSSIISSPGGFYSAFLNAQGRILHDVFIYPATPKQILPNTDQGSGDSNANAENGFVIEVDANETDALAKWLRRYKLRAKISITKIEDGEWGVYSAWSSHGYSFMNSSRDSPYTDQSPSPEILMVDNRAPYFGLRVLLPIHPLTPGRKAFFFDDGQLKVNDQVFHECSIQQYHIRRILHGIPEGQSEIQKEIALPQESNLDYMLGVDFRKGCYVGQELTIRTHHTGVVRKRILPVMLYSSDGDKDSQKPEELVYNHEEENSTEAPPPGTQHNISLLGGNGRSTGKWLRGVGNLGLALCRLETMIGVQDEFKMQWEDAQGNRNREVKVKAFVPKWHRERQEMVGLKKV
ncbi:ccr4 associated factor [Varicellaria rhodocarpa]|nr:ccr4 associated factor [Varicellaria rhodocarpa]